MSILDAVTLGAWAYLTVVVGFWAWAIWRTP